MARLKGMPPWKVIVRHALPNAWAPIINVVALNLAYLITGVVLVEVVFVYPGHRPAAGRRVSKRDFPVVQACCLIFAATFILFNLRRMWGRSSPTRACGIRNKGART
jgi:peptide/nickel transport system permease protein